MWRRGSRERRELVEVEVVATRSVSAENPPAGPTTSLNSSVFDGAVDRRDHESASPIGGASTTAVDPGVGVTDTPVLAPPGSHARSRVRWPVVAVTLAVLIGVVAWTTLRSPPSSSDLDALPINPRLQYQWRVERATTGNIVVVGNADQPYVLFTNEEQGRLDALDGDGNLRWTVDTGAGAWGTASVIDDTVLVTVTGPNPENESQNPDDVAWVQTMMMVNVADGTTKWNVTVPGTISWQNADGIVVASERRDAASTIAYDTESPASPIELRLLDLATGEVQATEVFDAIGLPSLGRMEFDAVAVRRDGSGFVIGTDLQPISTPVPVAPEALLATDGSEMLVIDDDVATLFGRDGSRVSSGTLDREFPSDTPTFIESAGDGMWLFATYSYIWDRGSCGAFRLDASGVTELVTRDGCSQFVTDERLSDRGTVALASGLAVDNSDGGTSTTPNALIGLPGGTVIAQADGLVPKADGYLFEDRGRIVARSFKSSKPRFEIAIGEGSRWSPLGLGLVVVEPDNTGSVNAVAVKVYR